jgi:putative peptide zinc metalloprotease protein
VTTHEISRSWPKLREDLTLYPGPTASNGYPTWTLHDPARNQYFSIDWMTFEVVSRMGLGSFEAISDSVSKETTLEIDEDVIKNIIAFLDENELIQRHDDVENALIQNRRDAREKSWFESLLHGYLFFRVPLLKPDQWLDRILPYFSFLFRSSFLKLTFVAFLMGLVGVYQQWEFFRGTLIDTFSLHGLMRYGLALIGIKFIHELGHALVAKKNGCRVPTMGLAFLVMWPVAYTDVTESWKLNSHQKRLQIAGAGIATELALGAWALLCWVIFPQNELRSLFFFAATTSIATTLAVNASPFMRFDGYFLLCDVLGMPNLHSRSFAYARWWFRKNLLSLDVEAPESFNQGRHRFVIGFAVVTMLYRLVVFTGIAILVYHYFFKALGLIMFGVEIWFFVLRPVWNEIIFWRKHLNENSKNEESPPVYTWFFWIIVILFIPLDVTVNSQGILKAEKNFSVITFQSSQVVKLPPPIGTKVQEGDVLMELSSLELEQKINLSKNKLLSLNKQLISSGFDKETLSQRSVLREEFKSAQETLNGLEKEKERLKPLAPFNGEIVDVDPDLFLNEWLSKNTPLVSMIDPKHWVVDCYITEADLKRIDLKNIGWFEPDAAGVPHYKLSVMSIDRDASKIVNDGSLASTNGGEVVVRMQNNKPIPENAIYHVRLKVDHLHEKVSTGYLRGHVVILAWPKSLMGDVIKNTLANLIREASF